ncbi:MAG: rod shape-determining protein MreD [Deltaproteobacteria bacterium]|nr:rod shape-determining protein MreD [Candidatus Anaeroferrophillus wilburensis]MBN2888176.1 rod shape-determining protein MreD [Deltaproteobacteria bacterium]
MTSKLSLLGFIYLLAGLFFCVFQSSVFPRLGFSNISPDLSYVLVVSLPAAFPVAGGALIAVALGILADTFSLASSGFHAIGFLVLFFTLVIMRQSIYFDRLSFQALLASLGYLSMFLLMHLLTDNQTGQPIQLGNGIRTAIATGIFAIPLLHVMRMLARTATGSGTFSASS